MKKMTMVLSMVLALVLMMTGCSQTEKAVSTTAATEKKEVETTAPATAEEPKGIEGALEGKVLKIGTSGLFAPFSYYAEDGKTLIGYDVDFLYALQDLLGFEIADDTVQAMDYSALTTSVAEGKLDVAMAALCATDSRKEVMNFSSVYYDSGQITVTNKETSPEGIESVESLATGDFKVAVEKGTASHLYAQENIPLKSIEVHDTITTAYESLEQGKVDALLQDTPGIAFYIKTKADTKLQMVGEEFNQGQAPYAVAISFDASKDNEELVEILNKGIETLTTNGTMDKITAEWCQ